MMMRAFRQNTMEQMESMVKQTNEFVLQTVNAQLTGTNATIKNMSNEEIHEKVTAMEARMNRLEDPDNRR